MPPKGLSDIVPAVVLALLQFIGKLRPIMQLCFIFSPAETLCITRPPDSQLLYFSTAVSWDNRSYLDTTQGVSIHLATHLPQTYAFTYSARYLHRHLPTW